MPAASAIVEQLIDGPGFVLLPNLIDASEAAQARSPHLKSPRRRPLPRSASSTKRSASSTFAGCCAHGEIFERLVQHPGDHRNRRGDAGRRHDPRRVLRTDSVSRARSEMGVHIDYPYWAMRGPFTLRPPLMMQVIWMLQDFTEKNGATLVAPRSQLRCTRPNREEFAREAIKITGAAGDAIISHGLLWHDTSQNHTERAARRATDQLRPEGDSAARFGDSESSARRYSNARHRNFASCSAWNSLIHWRAI